MPVVASMPCPERLRRELAELQKACGRVADAYQEAYEAGLTPVARGMVATSGHGFSSGEQSDPTGETVISVYYARIRGAVRYVAKSVRRAGAELERSQQRLLDAFLDGDPDLRGQRRAKREAALPARGR